MPKVVNFFFETRFLLTAKKLADVKEGAGTTRDSLSCSDFQRPVQDHSTVKNLFSR
jgi:hypothetical protein